MKTICLQIVIACWIWLMGQPIMIKYLEERKISSIYHECWSYLLPLCIMQLSNYYLIWCDSFSTIKMWVTIIFFLLLPRNSDVMLIIHISKTGRRRICWLPKQFLKMSLTYHTNFRETYWTLMFQEMSALPSSWFYEFSSILHHEKKCIF